MKKYFIFGIFALSLSSLFGQNMYANLFCEGDTLFNGKLNVSSEGLMSRSCLFSDFNASALSNNILQGSINGITLNKLGSTVNTVGNIPSIESVIMYVTTTENRNGFQKGHVYKVVATTSREPSIKNISLNSVTELSGTSLFGNNYLSDLGKIRLGLTSFSSSSQKGNYFFDEHVSKSNSELFLKLGDTTSVSVLQKISGATYPSDDANYQTIMGDIKAFENTGWMVEVDRLGDKFNGKRYDLGRGNRIDYWLQSIRSSSANNVLASVINSYQIFGDSASIIVKTSLSNGIQKFYVYNENQSISDYFVLMNDVVAGNPMPLTKNQLLDIYALAIKKGATLFPKISSIAYSYNMGSLIIGVQGGKFPSVRFSDTSIVKKSTLSKLFTSYDDGAELNVKYGSLLYLDLVNNKLINGVTLGNTGVNNKIISNPGNLSVHNFSYTDSNGNIQNFEYMALVESVSTNEDKQNPSRFSDPSDFQNEVYVAQIPNNGVIDKASFKLLSTLPKNSDMVVAEYKECYIPFLGAIKDKSAKTIGGDSVLWMDGFANNFINGTTCNNASVKELTKPLNFYPNPFNKTKNNVLTISDKLMGNVAIYNMQGALVMNASSNKLDLSNVACGIYVIKSGNYVGKLEIIE